jgi:hypothetical protein
MKAREVIEKEVIAARESGNPVFALRLLCERYSQEELHEAKNHFNCISTDPLGMVVLEAINRMRHRELNERLIALEKPHWTLVPTFWAVIGTAIIGVVGIVIACFAWRDPMATSEDNPSNQLSPNPPVTMKEQLRSASQSAPTATNSVAVPSSPKK